MICRVELYRTRKKGDAFPPLSQLELTLGVVEACPARLSQLFMQFRGDLCFRFKRLSRAEPLKTGDDRENGDRCHHRVTDLLLGPFASFSLRDARIDIITLFPAERPSGVFYQLFAFGQVQPRFGRSSLCFPRLNQDSGWNPGGPAFGGTRGSRSANL